MPSPLCEEKYQYGLVMGKRAENVDGLLLPNKSHIYHGDINTVSYTHLTLPTTRRSCVDLGGRRIIKKKKETNIKKNINN
nr:hypothetical protein [Escherichia coli]